MRLLGIIIAYMLCNSEMMFLWSNWREGKKWRAVCRRELVT
jgi:hypothetical protein